MELDCETVELTRLQGCDTRFKGVSVNSGLDVVDLPLRRERVRCALGDSEGMPMENDDKVVVFAAVKGKKRRSNSVRLIVGSTRHISWKSCRRRFRRPQAIPIPGSSASRIMRGISVRKSRSAAPWALRRNASGVVPHDTWNDSVPTICPASTFATILWAVAPNRPTPS